jgi:hypothetical protein
MPKSLALFRNKDAKYANLFDNTKQTSDEIGKFNAKG